MLKRMIVGAGALAFLAGVAMAAADNGNNPPPPPNDTQIADNGSANPPPPPPPPPGDGQDQGWGGAWHRWMGHGHRHGMMGPDGGPGGPGGPGPMGMMMHMKGFRMNLGNGVHVDVACGEEPMKDCVASAQTLIDAAKTAAAAQPAAPAKTP